MAGEWTSATLQDVCSTITDGAHQSPQEDPEGLPMASVKDLTRHGIELGDCKRISAADFTILKRQGCMPELGDVLIAKDGNSALDTVCVHRLHQEVVLLSSVAILRPNARVDSDFLHYYLDAPQTRALLKAGFRSGSAIPRVVLKDFRRAPVTVPPLREQRAIAHILGTLDDKIELNRRMNETLEAMARALFKSWFVDFDPVRAKAEGRDPGLPKPLADLFPDSFEDSELEEIPKEWKVGTLADFAILNSESWSKETRPEVINYVDLSNTKWGSIEAVTCYAQRDAPSRAQRVLRPGDTIVGTVRPGNGSYAFISADELTGSTGFAVLRPRRTEYAQFVYLGATASENIETLSHLADGGAYPAVRPEVVIATQVIRPSDKVLARFSMLCAPLLGKIAQNERESYTLAAQRDALLPKLISGELRIKQAKHLFERTA